MWRPEANQKVDLMHSSRVGNKTLALTLCPINASTHCYTWSQLNSHPRKDGTAKIVYLCAECRKIRDAKRVSKDTPIPSVSAIRGVNREVRWDGLRNIATHFCEGPKELFEMRGEAAKRSLGAELATGAVEKSSASVVKLERKILERVDGQNSLPQMRKAASCHSIGALKKFFQRCTRKRFPPLKYLRDLKEEEFKSLHYTHRGAVVKPSDEGFQENFLIYANKSMAIFGLKKQLNLFRCSKTLIFDGLFKYRPQDTYQIYRGFGFINETHCLPLVTVLMRGKHRNLYEKMWRKIAEVVEPLGKMRTKSANFDCEPAAYKSFEVQFKNVEVKMCSFHVKQALNKKKNKHQKPEQWGHSKELILAARLYQYNFILFKPFEKPKFVFFSAEYEQVNTPLTDDRPMGMIRQMHSHFDVVQE